MVTESHPESQAVSLGVWVLAGPRDEPNDLIGVSHLVEHMVFKGTRKRNAFEIAKSLEAVGGELNAYTTREYTCYHGTSLKEDLSLNLDVLLDMAGQATFPVKEYAKEKDVILQEISMAGDNLEEYAFDLFFEEAFKKNPIGRPVLGTEKSIKAMPRAKVMDFYRDMYRPQNLIVSGAGNLKHEALVEIVNKLMGKSRKNKSQRPRRRPKLPKMRKIIEKPSEQVHMLVSWQAASFNNPYRFAAFVLNSLLGGGMTSHLYQSVREKKGLAYSVYSYLHTFTDYGVEMIYAGTTPDKVKKVMGEILKTIEKVCKKGVSKKELDLFKTQVKGNILLASDDIENRMTSLGVNEMVFKEYRSVASVVEEIEKVTQDQVNEYINEYLNTDTLAVLLLGNFSRDKNQTWLESL